MPTREFLRYFLHLFLKVYASHNYSYIILLVLSVNIICALLNSQEKRIFETPELKL